MYIDDHINKKMSKLENLTDISNFIKSNQSQLTRYRYGIIDRIRKMPYSHSLDEELLNTLFFNHSKISDITDVNFSILEAYCNRVRLTKLPPVHYLFLYLLLLKKENIESVEGVLKDVFPVIYVEILRDYIGVLFDLYIATDAPEDDIEKVLTESDYSLSKIVEYTEHFMVRKIYTQDGYKIDALQSYLIYSNITVKFIRGVDEICNRFIKYYDITDTGHWVYELLHAMKYTDKVSETINWIISDMSDKYEKINYDILHLLLLEIISLSRLILDLYHFNEYKGLITSKSYLNQKATEGISDVDYQYSPEDGLDYVMEAYKKNSSVMHSAQHKIYKSFKKYKNAEDKIDSQVTKMTTAAKGLLIGDVRSEIVEGKKVTALGLVKSALASAAIFSIAPIRGLMLLLTRYALKKKTTVTERKKIILELEAELEMIEEKIDDARGDGNREAKYALMRTRTEIVNAIRKIKLGLEADERSISTAKSLINKK